MTNDEAIRILDRLADEDGFVRQVWEALDLAKDALRLHPEGDLISRSRTLAAIQRDMKRLAGGAPYYGLELAAEIVRRQEAVRDER